MTTNKSLCSTLPAGSTYFSVMEEYWFSVGDDADRDFRDIGESVSLAEALKMAQDFLVQHGTYNRVYIDVMTNSVSCVDHKSMCASGMPIFAGTSLQDALDYRKENMTIELRKQLIATLAELGIELYTPITRACYSLGLPTDELIASALKHTDLRFRNADSPYKTTIQVHVGDVRTLLRRLK